MIKINLLPTKRKKKAKPLPVYLVTLAFLLLLSIGLVIFANSYLNDEIKKLNDRHKANEKTLAELNEKIKEVKNYETLNEKFKARKQVIEDLRKSQSLPVKVLDEISARLSDGVWIATLSINANNITITGTGFNNTDIVTYVENMKGSPFFSEVILQSTQKQVVSGYDTYVFSMSLKIKA